MAVDTGLTTWVFDADSFVPSAKLVGNKSYSIVSDYLGTPCQAYSETGAKVWEYEQKSYGGVESLTGAINFIPFRYQGQYEDVETGLYYNRFRYYDTETGSYISQDPIGLFGGFELYSYVNNPNFYVDALGLSQGSQQLGNALNNAGHTHGGIVTAANRSDFRAHHVIPHKVWTEPAENKQFFEDIGLGKGKDKAANGVWLPKNANVATTHGFDHYHAGNHSTYSNRVRGDVENIRDRFNNGTINKKEARKEIRDLQRREKANASKKTNNANKSVIH